MEMLKSIFRLAAGIMLALVGVLVLYVGVVFVMDRAWSNNMRGKVVTTTGKADMVTMGGAADSAAIATLDSTYLAKHPLK